MTVAHEEEGDGLDDSWTLWAVVVLSCWPLVEVYKALLHSMYACREHYGLGAAAGKPREPLARFVRLARQQLRGFAAELRFVKEHPLWCGVTLQPLFRAVRWDAAKVSFLLLCLLSDQRVLLHTARRELLYPAAAALRSLIAPLAVAGIFIPYLPSSLLGAEETEALINEATQPYLIGCESSLLQSLPRVNPELVVLDLDTGSMKHPVMLNGVFSRRALMSVGAVHDLCLQLQEGMGDGARFRPPEIRAACLGFVLGFCDPAGGAFAAGCGLATARDSALAETLAAVTQLSGDIAERFGRDAEPKKCAELQKASSAAEAALFPKLASGVAKGSASEGDAAPVLEMVWSSMPFNVWWQSGSKADVILHLLQHRTERRVLLEYMQEHLRSLQLVEANVEGALQETFASVSSAVS